MAYIRGLTVSEKGIFHLQIPSEQYKNPIVEKRQSENGLHNRISSTVETPVYQKVTNLYSVKSPCNDMLTKMKRQTNMGHYHYEMMNPTITKKPTGCRPWNLPQTNFKIHLNIWVIFSFKMWFHFLMSFTLSAIIFYETSQMQYIFGQHCGYWWPGALAFWVLMFWCFSTKVSVATVLSTHSSISRCYGSTHLP